MTTTGPEQLPQDAGISTDFTDLDSVPLDLGGRDTRVDTPEEVAVAADAILLATNFDPDVQRATDQIHAHLDPNGSDYSPDLAYRELQDLTMRVNVARLIGQGENIDFDRVKRDLTGIRLSNVSIEEAGQIFNGSDPDHILHQQHISPETIALIVSQEHLYGATTREFVAGEVAALEQSGALAQIDTPVAATETAELQGPITDPESTETDLVQPASFTEETAVEATPASPPVDLSDEITTLDQARGYRTSQLTETEAAAVDAVLDSLGVEAPESSGNPVHDRVQRIRTFQAEYMPETRPDGDAGPGTRAALIREASLLEQSTQPTAVSQPVSESPELQAAVATLVTTPGNVFRTADLSPEQASAARTLLETYGGPEAAEILADTSGDPTAQLYQAARAFERDLEVRETGDIGPNLRAALIERAAAEQSEPAALPRTVEEVVDTGPRDNPHAPVHVPSAAELPDMSKMDRDNKIPTSEEAQPALDVDALLYGLPDVMPITTGGEATYYIQNGEAVAMTDTSSLPRGVNYLINGIGYEMGHDTSPSGFYGDGGYSFTTGTSRNSTESFVRDFAAEYGDRFPEMRAEVDSDQVGPNTLVALLAVHSEMRENNRLARTDSSMRTEAY